MSDNVPDPDYDTEAWAVASQRADAIRGLLGEGGGCLTGEAVAAEFSQIWRNSEKAQGQIIRFRAARGKTNGKSRNIVQCGSRSWLLANIMHHHHHLWCGCTAGGLL